MEGRVYSEILRRTEERRGANVMRFGSKKPTTLAVGGIEPRSFFV